MTNVNCQTDIATDKFGSTPMQAIADLVMLIGRREELAIHGDQWWCKSGCCQA